MTAPREWERWEATWRMERASSVELEQMIARTNHARRALAVVRVLSTAIASTALAIVGAALRHAANPFEAALGLVVAVGIGAVWLADSVIRRDARTGVEAAGNEYRAARRALCARQIRVARLGWAVVALDLTFLIPWWIGGVAVHGSGFHLVQLLTIWTPLSIMLGFVGWTIALNRRARAELTGLATSDSEEWP